MRSKRRSVAMLVTACIVIWATPVAVAVVSWTIAAQHERQAVSAPVIDYTIVGKRVDPDVRETVVDVRYGSALPVPGSVEGVVTGVETRQGESLTDGTPVVSIDGTILVAYTQELPQYRPLQQGDTGSDVRALQVFLSALGLLSADLVDETFGYATASAVREYQRAHGHSVNGVFQPGYVLYVGSAFVVDRVPVRVGQRVDPGTEIVVGAATASSVTMRDSQLKPLAPFASLPLVLELGGTAFTVGGPLVEGQDAIDLARQLAATPTTSESIEDGRVQRYANARLSLAEPIAWGALPSSAVYVSGAGNFCMFTAEEAVALAQHRESTTEFGTVLVPEEFVGERVVLDAASLPQVTLEQCN